MKITEIGNALVRQGRKYGWLDVVAMLVMIGTLASAMLAFIGIVLSLLWEAHPLAAIWTVIFVWAAIYTSPKGGDFTGPK